MPSGVPVATVGIGNSKNAGLLAVKILATSDAALAEKMNSYMQDLESQAKAKGEVVRRKRQTPGFTN
jgi:5-(carboxyamino)imidazole ribonucleotide mutase